MKSTGEQHLGGLLHRVALALRTEVTTTVLEPLGLTFPEYICMRTLARAPGRSNAELARDMNVSPQAMNMVVRELQARDLVARPAAVSSGRSRPAELTRQGIALLERTNPGVAGAEQHLLAALSAADRRDFRRMLAVLAG